MKQYDIVAENPESTVVADYRTEYRNETKYQPEAKLEKAFITQLQTQAYQYLQIKSENDLINNLRLQLEKLQSRIGDARLRGNDGLRGNDVYNKRVVIIFDECHRSQFGDQHDA